MPPLTSPESTVRQVRALRRKVGAANMGISRQGIVDLVDALEWLAAQVDQLVYTNERLTAELAAARR